MQNSRHASTRARQRAIPPILVDLLLQFGSTEPAGNGTSKYFFDKRARQRVKTYAGQLSTAIGQHLDVYAVVGPDDKIITVAHRTNRIQRH